MKREQGDIGKLKQNNEKLKMEMQSLKAMLAAQAKEDAADAEHKKELEAKEAEVAKLEKRVQELEKELAVEKATVEKLEADIKKQAKEIAQLQQPASPRSPLRKSSHHTRKRTSSTDNDPKLAMPDLPEDFVSPHVLAQHKAHLRKLEEELKAERKHRREADGEVIKLRAQISGVELPAADVDALLAKKLESAPPPPPLAQERQIERYVSIQDLTGLKVILHEKKDRPIGIFPLGSRRLLIALLTALIVNLAVAGQLVRRRSHFVIYQKALQFIEEENLPLETLFAGETEVPHADFFVAATLGAV